MTQTLGITNASIQLFAILSFQYFSLLFPLYFVMGMMCILIGMQTIAAGGVFAGIDIPPAVKENKKMPMITLLVSILYFLSAYHIHLIGFSYFAVIAATHAAIMFISSIFAWIIK
jgi:hypothetical protein